VFLPLCGKTRDIAWLLGQGYRIAGAELSEIAVRALFEELETEPVIAEIGELRRYSAPGLDVFAGDIFALDRGTLGSVDAVYDRAALVALPDDMRTRYAAHLAEISGHAPQLLITFEYDQNVMAGPPFSITEAEVSRCHAARFDIARLAEAEVPGGLKGICPATEKALLLRPRQAVSR
jgi:thiopurine S-methyltransferase